MDNIPYSKYKNIEIFPTLSLTSEQKALFDEVAYNSDWGSIFNLQGRQDKRGVKYSSFKEHNMNTLLNNLDKIARACPFLTLYVSFSHDWVNDDGDEVLDDHICTIRALNGKVDTFYSLTQDQVFERIKLDILEMKKNELKSKVETL